MLETLQWMFSNLAIYLGCLILITMLINGFDLILSTFLHGMNIRKHGWPPTRVEDTDETGE